MLRKIATIISIAMLLFLFTTQITLADIEHFNWINPAYVGPDPYYPGGATIIAYKEGTPWNISLSVKNDYRQTPPPAIPKAVNVTGIKVYFDWGKWYNYTFGTPIKMEIEEVKVFQVGNVTPMVSEAPETWLHEYWVYVEYIPEGGVEVEYWDWHGGNFAVLSENHLVALILYNKMSTIMKVQPPLWYMINVTQARVLMIQSSIKFTEGMSYYSVGIFSTARTSLESASSFFDEALSIWDEKGTALEDAVAERESAEANYYNALADSTRKGADAAVINSYGLLFFGLGWIIIGIGLIGYVVRKPKAA